MLFTIYLCYSMSSGSMTLSWDVPINLNLWQMWYWHTDMALWVATLKESTCIALEFRAMRAWCISWNWHVESVDHPKVWHDKFTSVELLEFGMTKWNTENITINTKKLPEATDIFGFHSCNHPIIVECLWRSNANDETIMYDVKRVLEETQCKVMYHWRNQLIYNSNKLWYDCEYIEI